MFLNKQLITYIFIIIFIIITSIHLYKININNDNNKEVFEDLIEEQNLQGFDVYINNMSQVKFGVKPNTISLLTSMNEKASQEELTVGLSDKVTKQELNDAMPELSIIAYSGSKAPTGWQICNGMYLTYKTGENINENQPRFDGMTKTGSTVNTPDLRGRFILGSNPAAFLDPLGMAISIRNITNFGGSETHTLTVDEMPAHTHSYAQKFQGHEQKYSGGDFFLLNNQQDTSSQSGPAGGNKAHQNMPPFYVLTYIIKQPTKL